MYDIVVAMRDGFVRKFVGTMNMEGSFLIIRTADGGPDTHVVIPSDRIHEVTATLRKRSETSETTE